MLQYPYHSHAQKQVIIFIRKEKIDMNLNLVTESKVTKCNRMSLKIFTPKAGSQARQEEWTGLHQMSFPKHVSEMPEMGPHTRGALHIIEK